MTGGYFIVVLPTFLYQNHTVDTIWEWFIYKNGDEKRFHIGSYRFLYAIIMGDGKHGSQFYPHEKQMAKLTPVTRWDDLENPNPIGSEKDRNGIQ